MSTKDKGLGAVHDAAESVSKADHETAVAAAREEGRTAGFAEGKAEGAKGVAAAVEKAHADGVTAGETAGRDAGATAERARILGIESLGLKGSEKLVAEMKADGKTTPEQAAIRIVKAQQEAGGTMLANLKADGAVGAAVAAVAEPASTAAKSGEAILADTTISIEERCKAAFEADPKIRDEFITLGALTAYQTHLEAGNVKIFKPQR